MNQTTSSYYADDGRVIATWGATYPVAYEYDAWGRMTAMATTRDPAYANQNLWYLLDYEMLLSDRGVSGYPAELDTTLWHYELPTGLLTNKLYADGHGPSYTYTPDGKLATRAWARGVTTRYAYTNGSSLAAIDYSDDTPDVSFTYDRLGRQKVAQTFLSAHRYAYDSVTLALASETIIDLQTATTNVLVRETDALGRPAGIALSNSPYAVTYGYDAFGRFQSATSAQSAVTFS